MKRKTTGNQSRRPHRRRPSVEARTALGWASMGAAAAGAVSVGALAIGALAIRKLAIRRGRVAHLAIEDLEVGRLRVGELIVENTRERLHPFEALEGHKYVRLTTFRRSGEGVNTVVWLALVDGRVYVTTPPDTGKMKRIRNNPRVVLAPCNPWGRLRGESVEGYARIMDGKAPERATSAFHEKYRLALAAFHLFGRTEIGEITLEISPEDDTGAHG